MKNNTISTKLIHNLKFFGLNPYHWKLVPGENSNQWYIINKKNSSLNMKGISSMSNKSPYWKDIELSSF